MVTEPIKGYFDYTGKDAVKRAKIKKIVEETFESFGFLPAETPIIEALEFVKGENTNDEAVSDVYRLVDKGERKLALRYEFTFQLKRIAQNKKLPYKRYQIGPVFRDEPVTGNRVRQITQCDIDIIGSNIKDEAEILKAVTEVLKKLKISFRLCINNRKLLNEILDELKIKDDEKAQVIREIDKLDKLSESEVRENLKKYGAEKALDIFKKPEKYFEKYNSYNEIKNLRDACKNYKIDFEFVPYLARGLSYYNGSVFEIKVKDVKETICGGGSYLVNGIQSTGISASIERLSILAKVNEDIKSVLIISINQDKKSVELSNEIRKLGIPASVFFGKPSKALEYANSYQISYVVFIGDNEAKKKKVKFKDMKSGKESLLSAEGFLKKLKKN